MEEKYPMRINKYLAHKRYSTRRGADELIQMGHVTINGRRAVLGDKVSEKDAVVVKQQKKNYRYFAYNKPRHVITHSPQGNEQDILGVIDIQDVFPVGRLDKDSHGLIILTDDGRVTDRLLNPASEHEKEYIVTTAHKTRPSFAEHMQKGVDIGGYVTKKCKVTMLGEQLFKIVLSEGKKHQIRRMCVALHTDVVELQRTRIMHVRLGSLKPGEYRALTGVELEHFLKDLGLSDAPPQK